jgi:hypothetical protein
MKYNFILDWQDNFVLLYQSEPLLFFKKRKNKDLHYLFVTQLLLKVGQRKTTKKFKKKKDWQGSIFIFYNDKFAAFMKWYKVQHVSFYKECDCLFKKEKIKDHFVSFSDKWILDKRIVEFA